MALTDLEQAIVNEHFIPFTAAYFQRAWLQYDIFFESIDRSEFPQKVDLDEVNNKMAEWMDAFNDCYLESLQYLKSNPLALETHAWMLLSPLIKKQVKDFGIYLLGYSPQTSDMVKLRAFVDSGWDLLQIWNAISDSYKAKYQKQWNKTSEKEATVKILIQELS